MTDIGLPLIFSTGTGPDSFDAVEALERLPMKVFGPRNLAAARLPEFVRTDHERFVAFMEAYYEWLETYGGGFFGVAKAKDNRDIDEAMSAFIDSFREMYLHGFPPDLAVAEDGSKLDPVKLMKNIRTFYKEKGSEKSFSLLFRILMDLPVEVYYPKQDILRNSAGRWVEEKSIRVTSANGNDNFQMLGRTVTQTDRITGEITAYGTVVRVLRYSIEQYDVTELFLEDVFGDFTTNTEITCTIADGSTLSESVFSVVSGFLVTVGGTGYRIGDKVVFTSSSGGTGAVGEVVSTTPKGAIKAIRPVHFGVNYLKSSSVGVVSQTGVGASVTIVPGALCRHTGYWSSNDGKISSNKRLFDGHFYQDFSYVLRSEASIERWRDPVRELAHPAGMKMFGQAAFDRTPDAGTDWFSMHNRFEKSRIGNYTPYNPGTTVDLWSRYQCGFNPSSGLSATHQNDLRLLLHRSAGFTLGFVQTAFSLTCASGGATSAYAAASLYPEDGSTMSEYIMFFGYGSGRTFQAGATVQASGGLTAEIVATFAGEGFVPEASAFNHDPNSSPLDDGSSDFLQSYWYIYHHPNTRGIIGLAGLTAGTGAGLSFGAMVIDKFSRMPFGLVFHSNPGTGPYHGDTGANGEYSYAMGGGTVSPNIGVVPTCP